MSGLTDAQDAYGHLVYDYLTGKHGVEVVERDDGLIGVAGGAEMYFATYDAWPRHGREAMTYVRGRVLDIGCGAGRHALYLQEQGFDVTGVDVSPLAITVCKRRGLRQAHVASIAQVCPQLGTFDTLLLLGANFGLCESAEMARQLLLRFQEMTSDNARIVAESRDPYSVVEPVHRAYQETNRRQGRMPGQIRIRIRHKEYVTPWFDYLFVSRGEMEHLLAGTGWSVQRFLDEDASGYIAIIEKQ